MLADGGPTWNRTWARIGTVEDQVVNLDLTPPAWTASLVNSLALTPSGFANCFGSSVRCAPLSTMPMTANAGPWTPLRSAQIATARDGAPTAS